MFRLTFHCFLLVGLALGAIENPDSQGTVQPSTQHSTSFGSSSFQSNFAVNNGSSASNSYQFVNGNCVVTNGVVRENGTERPVSEEETREIEQYEKDMEQYGVDFSNSMQQWSQNMMRQMFDNFGASFPFGGGNRREQNREPLVQPVMPKMPRVPCFCQSCKTAMRIPNGPSTENN